MVSYWHYIVDFSSVCDCTIVDTLAVEQFRGADTQTCPCSAMVADGTLLFTLFGHCSSSSVLHLAFEFFQDCVIMYPSGLRVS
jgi:hypothetical protein